MHLTQKSEIILLLCAKASYQDALLALAELKPSIGKFFDEVMVMAEDPQIRTNRLALLLQLRKLLGMVADISLLYAII